MLTCFWAFHRCFAASFENRSTALEKVGDDPEFEPGPEFDPEFDHSPELDPEFDHSLEFDPEFDHSLETDPVLE